MSTKPDKKQCMTEPIEDNNSRHVNLEILNKGTSLCCALEHFGFEHHLESILDAYPSQRAYH